MVHHERKMLKEMALGVDEKEEEGEAIEEDGEE